MDSEQYERIAAIFARACGLPPNERSDLLERECGGDARLRAEVESLLAADAEESGFLETPAFEGLAVPRESSPPPIPARIGPYEILGVIRSGGMGTILEATQRHPRRTVALKLFRAGLASADALRRFRDEAGILARLRHPGIAQVYDAGTYREGGVDLPYFTLEFVPGARSLTTFAREGALAPRARLELFLKVCDAVQHAHENGVIHRDLKPENILVDERGEPKVLDFGTARITEPARRATRFRTIEGLVLGTVPYMSPEHLAGRPEALDTRADVYSLGVILFELLAGRLPYSLEEKSIAEAARILEETDPPRLRNLVPGIEKDLDVIVRKALEKDKARRYPSSAELAADLRRFLANEPIQARPPTTLYHLRTFVRRNPAAFVATLALVLSLFGTAVASLYQATRVARQRDAAVAARREAERARDQTLLVSGFIQNVLFGFDVYGGQPFVPYLLQHASEALASESIQDVGARAMLHDLIGRSLWRLHVYEPAEENLAKSVALHREAFGETHPSTASALQNLARLYASQGRPEACREALRQVLRIRRAHYGPNHMESAPNDNLRLAALAYLPEEPEAAAAGRPAATHEGAFARFDGQLVFEDDFAGDTLDPRWSVTFHNALGWKHRLGDSRLVVEEIQPRPGSERSDGAPETTPRVVLSRPLPRAGNIHVEFDLAWDNAGPRGSPPIFAMSQIRLSLYADSGRPIVSAGYADSWIDWCGERWAHFRPEPTRSTWETVHSGAHTLPGCGTASVAVDRVGDRVTVRWDGEPFATALIDEPPAEVSVEFWFYPDAREGKVSHLGTLAVERIRVEGAKDR